ncbi:MAG TPA: hypothetical protein PKE69_26050 [Pyrinomonadaceae bacterium]|nr:hypothetical protein [Pyrinomonadaceae bacterium]
MKKSIFTIIFISFLSFSAFADIRLPDTPKPTATPKPQKSIDSNITIRLDQNATEATLIIPKDQIKQLRAQLDGLDDTNEPILTFSRTQTIVSGLFLSLAIVFGGVWFSRRGKANKTLVAGAVLFLFGSAATIVFANIGPPVDLRTISGKLFNKEVFSGWNRANGKIKVKVADTGNTIELIVPNKEETKKTDE